MDIIFPGSTSAHWNAVSSRRQPLMNTIYARGSCVCGVSLADSSRVGRASCETAWPHTSGCAFIVNNKQIGTLPFVQK